MLFNHISFCYNKLNNAVQRGIILGRPRNFNEGQALNQAMTVFWSKGYEATSLMDILKATGLSKSSLYETFGSKRSLFLLTFQLYRDERKKQLSHYLNSGETAIEGINNFFTMVKDHSHLEERPIGCMSCNEAVELSPHDPEIREFVKQDFQDVEDSFHAAILRGQSDGSIKQADARVLARFLTVSLQGIQVVSRSQSDEQRIEDTISTLLIALSKS